ncbi:hypothetical protein [Planctomicrobium sp. SH664]|uniref:hypothetical protein n=1 Tax=Planctomicrobium sp. SH664 TaxID=3448125 RepID=UPI003F5C1F7B
MPFNEHQSPEDQNLLSIDMAEDDYEVITSEDVDRVLDSLDQLIASTTSENIRVFLEEAADNIYSLVYSDEELDADGSEEQDEAA